MTKVFYADLVLDIDKNVYEPREDSFLMAKSLEINAGQKILEIGTGSGILAILAAKKGAAVVATDINPAAVECAKKNAKEAGVEIDFRTGDIFEPIKRKEKFDAIIFNPPYLPKENTYTNRLIDFSYNGTEAMQKFLEGYKNFLAKNGIALIVNSSISEIAVTGKVIASEKLAFEEIFVIGLG